MGGFFFKLLPPSSTRSLRRAEAFHNILQRLAHPSCPSFLPLVIDQHSKKRRKDAKKKQKPLFPSFLPFFFFFFFFNFSLTCKPIE